MTTTMGIYNNNSLSFTLNENMYVLNIRLRLLLFFSLLLYSINKWMDEWLDGRMG